MERKTVHALLLSLAVVTGGVMMTTDAHAQTNTERLITTVDNTNSILDALAALADTIASGFASVMESLGMVQADVGAINANLQHVESDLQSIDSDLMAIDEDLMAIDGDLQSIDSDLMAIDEDLVAIDGELSGLSATVGASGAAFNEVNVNMNKISDAVAANSAAINDLSAKLDMISEAVGVVQETVVAPATADPATTLHSGVTELAVAVADFAGSVTKHPTTDIYTASNMFSCDGDVFLDDMTLSDVNRVLSGTYDVTGGADFAPTTLVTVNGFSIYETFDTSAAGTDPTNADIVNIGKERDFDNQFLSSGSSLVIKGETDKSTDRNAAGLDSADNAGEQSYLQYVVDDTESTPSDGIVYFTLENYVALESNKDTIAAKLAHDSATHSATKAQLGTVELYTVTVNWFATSSDTTCTISSAVETSSGLPNTDRDLLVGLSLDATSDEGPPTPFTSETVDCNGEDTEVTGVSIKAGDVGLNSFISLELSAAGETANVSFNDDDGTFDEDGSELPFRFTGADLTVSGKGLNNLLLELVYDTTQGNSCN